MADAVKRQKPDEIRAYYAERIAQASEQSRVEIGQLLLEAKAKLPHGEFQDFVKRDLPRGMTQQWAWVLMEEAKEAASLNHKHACDLPKGYRARIELRYLPLDKRVELIEQGIVGPESTHREVKTVVYGILGKPPHRPLSAVRAKVPVKPSGPTARSFPELIWLLQDWRAKRAMTQLELDAKIGWSEGQTSKYEIPHQDDGRMVGWDAFFDWLAGLGLTVMLVPIETEVAKGHTHRDKPKIETARAVAA